MLLKYCNRCGQVMPYGAIYCKACADIVRADREARRHEANKMSNIRYNKKRKPKYIKFYNSSEWRILANKRLQDDKYKCVMCGKVASEVDHIVPIQTDDGWARRLDYSNTQSLCLSCHNKKHKRFLKKCDIKRY